MYFAENDAQPETFSSIPASMWWAIITITTVGYGDVVPVTTFGRVLTASLAVLGIGLIALPGGYPGQRVCGGITSRKGDRNRPLSALRPADERGSATRLTQGQEGQ